MWFNNLRRKVFFSPAFPLMRKENVSDDGNMTKLTDCIADCQDALVYFRKHASELGIDPKRVAVIGDSAGGHLALCMGIFDSFPSARANAVIDCNGITDFNNKKWQGYLPNQNDLSAEIKKYSPLFNLDKSDPPLLILNGKKDKVVTAEESEKLYYEAKKAGIDAETILFDDMQHAFILTNYTATKEQTTKAILEIDKFLKARGFLKGKTILTQ